MSPGRRHKRRHEQGMTEARRALASATEDLNAAKARWPLVHALTRQAHRVGGEAAHQKTTNHLGDLFANALGEG